ncbi:lytic transglycosylase domain-containing protein [Methylococcus sp. EFPC2]|uniref:lytic transglycosylase domain-containing protein n=1 Tax=Methylococcus sp. EFPC2 TaxID=2812648 RepID=UPI001F07C5EF|nr:lytic transglycosylase domain-containing protein [Methylococcus sp. EFPC2]
MKTFIGGAKSKNQRRGIALAATLLLSPSVGFCEDSLPNTADNTTLPAPQSRAIPRDILQGTAWWQIATERGLDPYILYAVALVESAQINGRLATPWPWALNRQGRPIIPSSRLEARGILNDTLRKGIRGIDVGLMQVNVRWNGHRVSRPDDLLDPETNIRVGADVLTEAIDSAPGDLTLGIGRYHTGWRNDADAYRYGRRVLAVAQQLRWLL